MASSTSKSSTSFNESYSPTIMTTPILTFTPSESGESSSFDSFSCSEEGDSASASLSSPATNVNTSYSAPTKDRLSKDTAYATLYHGYGRPSHSSTSFHSASLIDMNDLPSSSIWLQNKPGAPSPPVNSANSKSQAGNPIVLPCTQLPQGMTYNTYESSINATTTTRRRHSSSVDNAIPYRQSSLKWKQRNGSATFELKLSQGEFICRS